MTIQAFRQFLFATLLAVTALAGSPAIAEEKQGDYKLGSGDTIRIQVFQNPDLTLETRVNESGIVTYPLIGAVKIGGLGIGNAEHKIASSLKDGGFVKEPQVNITLLQVRGNQVSVLGQVNRPGRFPLETFNTRVSEMLATAGGIAPTGADIVIVQGVREGQPFRQEIDVASIYLDNHANDDIIVNGGDTVYVHRAPMFYIYGEVQRPGSYRVERGMTIQQALAQGGGPTVRGSESRLRLHRRANGKTQESAPAFADPVAADDVLYIRESIF